MVIFHQGASKLLFKITCLEAIVLFAYIHISDGHKTAFSLMSRYVAPLVPLTRWPSGLLWPHSGP